MEYSKINSVGIFTEYNKVLYYKKSQHKEVFKHINGNSLKIGNFNYIDFFNIGGYFRLRQTFLYNIELQKEENYFSNFLLLKEGEGFDVDADFNGILICRKIFYSQKEANTVIIDFVKKEILYEFPWRGNIKGLLHDNAILFSPNIEVSETFISFDLQTFELQPSQ